MKHININDIDWLSFEPEALQQLNELVNLENDEKELIKSYTLSDGRVFSEKMFYDLLMWKNFARDYHYDRLGIKQLRFDLDKLKVYIHKYGNISDNEVETYSIKHNLK